MGSVSRLLLGALYSSVVFLALAEAGHAQHREPQQLAPNNQLAPFKQLRQMVEDLFDMSFEVMAPTLVFGTLAELTFVRGLVEPKDRATLDRLGTQGFCIAREWTKLMKKERTKGIPRIRTVIISHSIQIPRSAKRPIRKKGKGVSSHRIVRQSDVLDVDQYVKQLLGKRVVQSKSTKRKARKQTDPSTDMSLIIHTHVRFNSAKKTWADVTISKDHKEMVKAMYRLYPLRTTVWVVYDMVSIDEKGRPGSRTDIIVEKVRMDFDYTGGEWKAIPQAKAGSD